MMPDYETRYFTMFRATDQAIRLLIQAQRECEELYACWPRQPKADALVSQAKSGDGTREGEKPAGKAPIG